jgi:hypothetical protein
MKTSTQALRLNKKIPPSEGEFPDEDEIKASELAFEADMELLYALLESDDRLSTSYEQIKRLNHHNAQLTISMHGLMNDKNFCIKQIKQLQKEIDRFKKMQRMNLVKP